jgi:hypothetical protein
MHFAAAAQVLLRFEISHQLSAVSFQLFPGATHQAGISEKRLRAES